MWLQVINEVKVTHQGQGHIKFKVKYLHPFKFYVAHALCKRVVCIRLKCYLLFKKWVLIAGFPDLSKVGMPSYITQRPAVFPLPKLGDLPHSLALGTVGMPGWVIDETKFCQIWCTSRFEPNVANYLLPSDYSTSDTYWTVVRYIFRVHQTFRMK